MPEVPVILRVVLNTLGDGFVEAIDDNRLRRPSPPRKRVLTHGKGSCGEAIAVPGARRPDKIHRLLRVEGTSRAPLSFIGDAFDGDGRDQLFCGRRM